MNNNNSSIQKSISLSMAGNIAYKSFISGCEWIIERSKAIGEDWQLKASKFDPGVKYLVKKELCIFKAETDIGSSFDESSALSDFDIEGDIEDRDSACKEISVSNSHHISFEYHVIFNESYSVPALYFQATKPDGKGLLLEEVWRMVPKLYENALEGKWSFITQIDHPILGHPVFHIHPCNTATMMGNLLTNKQNMDNYKYLLMWLSALGPLVGLRLANGFFMDNQN